MIHLRPLCLNTSTTINIPFESLLSLHTTTQPEQHDYPSSFQPTNTIHKPKHYTSIYPRSRNSPHRNEFPFQNSLAQSLPTLLCPPLSTLSSPIVPRIVSNLLRVLFSLCEHPHNHHHPLSISSTILGDSNM